jgi:asparagine synthase (glutamine-hydrolysing)
VEKTTITMCGIVGSIQTGEHEPFREQVRRAMDHMVHRGPDAKGFDEFVVTDRSASHSLGAPGAATVLFGHRRLAIIDLSENARQPMSTPDGRFHLVFNGEIYNYREIGAELKNVGQTLRTHSDAEVLLLGWKRWGTNLLPRLTGMFSFAVLDQENATVLLARDPFGIKPLYYFQGRDSVVFASEITPLLNFPGISRRADAQTVFEFLSGVFGEHSKRTFFQDIQQLAAGHYLLIPCLSPGAAAPVCYWEVERKQVGRISPEESSSRFRELFEKSVDLNLRSDVPVGISLSGGMDSASITAMARSSQGPGYPLHTFSYVAEDPQLSERRWCEIVARDSSTDQHWVHIQPGELIRDFDQLVRVQEQPFGSPTIYAQYRIFRCAHEEGVKVILTGQGADQYLGYIHHLPARLASLLRQRQWGAALRFLRHARALPISGALRLRSLVRHTLPAGLVDAAKRMRASGPLGLNREWFQERRIGLPMSFHRANHPSLHDLLKQNIMQTLPGLMRIEDRNAMAFSVENRVPFLTTELVDFVFCLPEEDIISDRGRCKAVLLRAMESVVPKEILERRDKIAFAMPVVKLNPQTEMWLAQSLRDAAAIPVLQASEVENHLKFTIRERPADPESHRWLWRWLTFIAWVREFRVCFD